MRSILFWGSVVAVIALFAAVAVFLLAPRIFQPMWSDNDLAALRSLWLENLGDVPQDRSNAVADEPKAVDLGRTIFGDTSFSGNGAVACTTCHKPDLHFTDGRPFAVGMDVIPLNAMTLIGASYSPWQTWNGKNDSQWAQALIPLENPVEHGGDRTYYAHQIAAQYRDEYEILFGPLPDLSDPARFPPHAAPSSNVGLQAAWDQMTPADQESVNQVFANIGKALAAFERTILPAPSRFDAYVAALHAEDQTAASDLMTDDEIAGLRLFIGKAKCINCHNGPLFSNHEFHNTAIPGAPGVPMERGRIEGVQKLLADPFNCLGPYSDADPATCIQLRFLVTEGQTLEGGFKTPTLRNVAETGPYMHAGQFATLSEVIRHYNDAGFAIIGHNELTPLGLSDEEMGQLEAFLHTLTEER